MYLISDWRGGMCREKGGYGDDRTDKKTDAAIVYEKETHALVGNSHAVFSADGSSSDVGLQYRSEAGQQLRRKRFRGDGSRHERLVRHFYR